MVINFSQPPASSKTYRRKHIPAVLYNFWPPKCNFSTWKIRRFQLPKRQVRNSTLWKRAMAWAKGIRASVYEINSGKPSEHTSILRGATYFIILINVWQPAVFPYIREARKVTKLQNKTFQNDSLNCNLFCCFSRYHAPTKSVAPSFRIYTTYNRQFLDSLRRRTNRRETSAFEYQVILPHAY